MRLLYATIFTAYTVAAITGRRRNGQTAYTCSYYYNNMMTPVSIVLKGRFNPQIPSACIVLLIFPREGKLKI